MKYGMSSKMGLISYDDDSGEVFIGRDFEKTRSYSERTADEIGEEVKAIIDQCYRNASSIILEYRDVLNACAELLLEKEKISREEFEALFENRETLADEASGFIGE
jgi:cell division protease FtsH